MDAPDISIIVPVYNVERYLPSCLDSLTGQTHRNIEIVCVNDGSKDGSGAVLERYAAADDRIRVISHENSGVAHSRNVALDAARGEYVLFVDSDDYIDLRSCELLLANARETGADIVVFGGKTFPTTHWADASFAASDIVYHDDSIQALLYEQGGRPLMCNKLYRRRLIEDGDLRFQEHLKLGEDHAFQFMAFPECKTISFMKDCLYYYRGRADSAIASRKDNHFELVRLHFDVVKYVAEEWRNRGYLVEHGREILEWACTFLYGDFQKSSFDDRAAFSREFEVFIGSCFSQNVRSKVFESLPSQMEQMCGAYRAADASPIFTVLVESLDGCGGDDVRASLQSLGRQTEQRVELFARVQEGQQGFEDVAREHAAHDCRMKVLKGLTLAECVKGARGRSVLCTSSNVVYEETLFEHVLKLSKDDLPLSSADVLVLNDANETLEVRDVFDAFQPDPSRPFEIDTTYSFDDLHGRSFEVASLSLTNKIFDAGFLKPLAEEGGSLEGIALCSLALCRSRALYPTKIPAVTTGGLRFGSSAEAKAFGARFVADLLRGSALAEDAAGGNGHDARSSYGLAACSLCMTLLSIVRDPDQFSAVLSEVRAAFSGTWQDVRCLAEERWGAERTERFDLVMEGEDVTAYGSVMSGTVRSLAHLNRGNLLMVGDYAARASKLSSDIEEFYGSISYRVGRAVTFVPRACVNVLKRVLGH